MVYIPDLKKVQIAEILVAPAVVTHPSVRKTSLKKYKNLRKKIVTKCWISIILQKPLKPRLLKLLTFDKSLFQRFGFL